MGSESASGTGTRFRTSVIRPSIRVIIITVSCFFCLTVSSWQDILLVAVKRRSISFSSSWRMVCELVSEPSEVSRSSHNCARCSTFCRILLARTIAVEYFFLSLFLRAVFVADWNLVRPRWDICRVGEGDCRSVLRSIDNILLGSCLRNQKVELT